MYKHTQTATRLMLLALAVWAAVAAAQARAVDIQTVLVDNPGNPSDQNYGAGRFGAVDQPFRIGAYEITNDQYAEFLNAVADTDLHGLFNTFPKGEPLGIERSGISGSFAYTVRPNMGNKPANAVSFWDAARFCNWLHNGEPSGSQGPGTTEDGAYPLNGVTNPLNAGVQRRQGARWFIPTEDQWYKAAFHHPAELGGDSDSYWLYPTRSNQAPAIATADSLGDISNPGANLANYAEGADWNGLNGNLTSVGSAGSLSESYYGTSDQAGNVWEWNETVINSSTRGLRGYSYDNHDITFLSAAGRINGFDPSSGGGNGNIGFRVASIAEIPEPSTLLLMFAAVILVKGTGPRNRF